MTGPWPAARDRPARHRRAPPDADARARAGSRAKTPACEPSPRVPGSAADASAASRSSSRHHAGRTAWARPRSRSRRGASIRPAGRARSRPRCASPPARARCGQTGSWPGASPRYRSIQAAAPASVFCGVQTTAAGSAGSWVHSMLYESFLAPGVGRAVAASAPGDAAPALAPTSSQRISCVDCCIRRRRPATSASR